MKAAPPHSLAHKVGVETHAPGQGAAQGALTIPAQKRPAASTRVGRQGAQDPQGDPNHGNDSNSENQQAPSSLPKVSATSFSVVYSHLSAACEGNTTNYSNTQGT